jgi:hypothetical protein
MFACLAVVNVAFTKSFCIIQDQLSLERVERMILQVSLLVKT